MDYAKQPFVLSEEEISHHFSKALKGEIGYLTKHFTRIGSENKLSRCVCRKHYRAFDWNSLYQSDGISGSTANYKVMCTFCNMTSETFNTPKEAIDDWNTKMLLLT